MKLYTPDKIELIEVTAVESSPEGVVIDGRIMGTMPMKAVLTPAELRRALRFLTPGIVVKLLRMLVAR